ncbi:hypothetical protein ACHQM5_021423 [Ranunculus cassubicifolius]
MATVELEAMRKEDFSWHPCKISLSSDTSSRSGLIVDFGSGDSNKVIFTKEEALTRLRIRSAPLQGDDCSCIKKGEHVLASQQTESGNLFFDAEVDKVSTVRHSKRNPCRCTFAIKWLKRHELGTVTLPASSVMKLAQNTLDSHPVVSEFVNSVDPFDYSGLSSLVSLIEETVFETDIVKQIEEFGRLADVSRKGSPDDCPLELKKGDLSGQVRHRTLASQVNVVDNQKSSRRATRSQRKVELESGKAPPLLPPLPQPASKEPDRLHLSPLGARAALASWMYKLPSDSELSANTVLLSKHTSTSSLDVTSEFMDSDFHNQEVVSIKNTSNKSLLARSQHKRLEKPVGTPTATRLTRSAKKAVGLSNDEAELKSSPEELKFSPTHTSRLTRSTIQKGNKQSDDAVKMNSPCEETKLCNSTHTPRLTRATIHKGNKSDDKIEMNSPCEEMKLGNPTHTTRLTRSAVDNETRYETLEVSKRSQKRKLVQNTDQLQTNQNAVEHLKDRTALTSSYEETQSPKTAHTPKFTRSAVHNEIRNAPLEVKKGPQKRKLRQDTELKLTNQNAVVRSNDGTAPTSLCEETRLPNTVRTPRFTRSYLDSTREDMAGESSKVNARQGEHRISSRTRSQRKSS